MKHGEQKQSFTTGAVRDTAEGKPRVDLLSPYAAERKGMVMTAGAKHYGERNWERGMPFSRVLASAERHLMAFKQGRIDEDHLAQAAWNLDALLHYDEGVKRGFLPVTLDDMPHYELLRCTGCACTVRCPTPHPMSVGDTDGGPNPDYEPEQPYPEYREDATDPAGGYQAVGEPNEHGVSAVKMKTYNGHEPCFGRIPEDDDGPRGYGSSDSRNSKPAPPPPPMGTFGGTGFVNPDQEAANDDVQRAYFDTAQRAGMIDVLAAMGCPLNVAEQVVSGISFTRYAPGDPAGIGQWAYVAGPMRGYRQFNFPEFDRARDALLANGYNVISPADIDRNSDPHADEPDKANVSDQTRFVMRDFWSLYLLRKLDPKGNAGNAGNAICLIDGWQHSKGAAGEAFMARWLGLTPLLFSGKMFGPTGHMIEPRWDDVVIDFSSEHL